MGIIVSSIKPEDWVLTFQPLAQPRLRLFCFANAGGSPAQFRSWQNLLPEGVEICAVQLPGQGSRFRERPFTRTGSLIEKLTEVISPALDVPFAFWGYSMGALVAFELTLALERSSHARLRQLFVAARRAPHTGHDEPPIHRLPDESFIQQIQSRYNGIPAAVLQEPELLELFMPVLRANFEMIETYHYQSGDVLDAPIVAFGGLSDPAVNKSALAAWGKLTKSTFQSCMFPGDHFFVQQHQPAILGIVSKHLLPFLS